MKKVKGGSHQDASRSVFQNARHLRDNLTDQERIVWNRIRKKQILDQKFRAQHSIGNYIIDFFCIKCLLGVEIDGDNHSLPTTMIYDQERTDYLNNLGIRIMRFKNKEVDENIEIVIERLTREVRNILKFEIIE